MAVHDLHPQAAELERFLAGELAPDDESSLVRHLDACAACRRELETAAGAPEWWSDARRFLSPDQTGELPRNLIPRAGEDDSEAPTAGPLSLDFLAPTDDPAMLGRVGVYEIAGVVGRGGAGIVLKAFERSLNRYVAIKVLAPHLATSAAARRRFAREAQAAAAVVHEHIVPIHAVDEHLGLPYMVMRYVPGRSLHERLEKQGTLGLREVLRIGLQTASGLAAAHAQGLVHRDIKPANILLEHGVERVLLTDFGLARAVDDASLTCSGVIAGTPQYMAPEQARGEAVDHRTDLFSLGSVLYAMCTGHSPFRAESTMGVLHRICHEAPRPIRDENPDVPEWFERIVRRLHAKEPGRRFQSAAEVAELLESRLAEVQRPGGGWRDPWWRKAADRATDWEGTNRWAWAAAFVAVFALVAAAVPWAAWSNRQPSATDSPPAAASAGAAVPAEVGRPREQPRPSAADTTLDWAQVGAEVEKLDQHSTRLEDELRARPADRPDQWWPAAKSVSDQLQQLESEEWGDPTVPDAPIQGRPLGPH